jgi:tRNA 2-selenouridine synthase
MPELTQITDFTHLFSTDTPLIDSRAPVEFKQGAFPYAQNLILMSNDEREQIGTCYKNKGQAKAIELGHQLVQGKAKDKRIEAWLKFIKNNPNGALYCFRGGLWRGGITKGRATVICQTF